MHAAEVDVRQHVAFGHIGTELVPRTPPGGNRQRSDTFAVHGRRRCCSSGQRPQAVARSDVGKPQRCGVAVRSDRTGGRPFADCLQLPISGKPHFAFPSLTGVPHSGEAASCTSYADRAIASRVCRQRSYVARAPRLVAAHEGNERPVTGKTGKQVWLGSCEEAYTADRSKHAIGIDADGDRAASNRVQSKELCLDPNAAGCGTCRSRGSSPDHQGLAAGWAAVPHADVFQVGQGSERIADPNAQCCVSQQRDGPIGTVVPQRQATLVVEIEAQVAERSQRARAPDGQYSGRTSQEHERATVHRTNVGCPGSFVYDARRAIEYHAIG